jgi:hypothetical protein
LAGDSLSGFEIRAATPADAPGIRNLFERVFKRPLSEEEWSWKFERNPDGWYGVVAALGDRIVGNYAGWPMLFLLDGREQTLYSVGDVATDPAVRGLGGRASVFRSMTERFYAEVGSRGVPFCFGFPGQRHEAASRRLVGSRRLMEIRELRIACSEFPPPPSDAGAGDFVGSEFDSLWRAAAPLLPFAAVRDRARANWRFHARPTRYYRMVWLGDAALTGWCALSVTGEEALVADLIVAETTEVPRLLAAAAAEAARMGASHLVLWETPGGPAASYLRRRPEQRRGAGFPLIVRTFDDRAADRFAESVHLVPALYDVI